MKQSKKIASRVLLTATCLASLVEVVGCAGINQFMFHPPKPYRRCPHLVKIGDGGDVAVLWLPTKDVAHSAGFAGDSGWAILYSHGNGEDLAGVVNRMEYYRSLGYSVLAYDYPGYGQSAGEPTEKGVYRNAEVAYRHLVDDLGFPENRILIVGYSIGTGPSCYLAEKHPVGGLVLNAPFLSAPRVITQIRILPIDPFPNIRRIPKIRCPILVFHGDRDRLIPHAHGERLVRKAGGRGELVTVPGANHYNIIEVLGRNAYGRKLNEFRAACEEETAPDSLGQTPDFHSENGRSHSTLQ